jgi:hypothetical protein
MVMVKDEKAAEQPAPPQTDGPANPNIPKTLPVPVAGRRYFDLGRNASYEAAKRGDLPVIRIGSRLRVPIAALERMLADAGRK